VAQIYDYSRLSPDPLHDLIVKDLGRQPKYLRGGPCVLDGKIILDAEDLAYAFGRADTPFRQPPPICGGVSDVTPVGT
jgi:hypothetical protein